MDSSITILFKIIPLQRNFVKRNSLETRKNPCFRPKKDKKIFGYFAQNNPSYFSYMNKNRLSHLGKTAKKYRRLKRCFRRFS